VFCCFGLVGSVNASSRGASRPPCGLAHLTIHLLDTTHDCHLIADKPSREIMNKRLPTACGAAG
jgi:hypothetical protein